MLQAADPPFPSGDSSFLFRRLSGYPAAAGCVFIPGQPVPEQNCLRIFQESSHIYLTQENTSGSHRKFSAHRFFLPAAVCSLISAYEHLSHFFPCFLFPVRLFNTQSCAADGSKAIKRIVIPVSKGFLPKSFNVSRENSFDSSLGYTGNTSSVP